MVESEGTLVIMACIVPISRLIVERDAMAEVLASGRESRTPGQPVLLKTRAGMPGRYEVADGLHRVAAAMRAGRRSVVAEVWGPDDEPLEPPFFAFEDLDGGEIEDDWAEFLARQARADRELSSEELTQRNTEDPGYIERQFRGRCEHP